MKLGAGARGLGLRVVLSGVALTAVTVAVAACSGGGGGGKGKLSFSRIGPDVGVVDGGSEVFVFGSNLASPASVVFGDAGGQDATVIDSHTLRVTAPAHAAGTVDVTLHSAGRTEVKPQAFRFIPGTEIEPANQNGVNDDFQHYEVIPLDYDFKAYIGAQDDVDVFHLHTPNDGTVTISLDWSASYTSGGLAGLAVDFYHGPDPSLSPEAYLGGSLVAVNGSGSSAGWTRMSYLVDGHGPFLVIHGIGDALHTGIDPVHPYILHVHWDPATPETVPADSFLFPHGVTPGMGAGASSITESEEYDQDFDWYAFTAANDGWARFVLNAPQLDSDTSFAAAQVGATLFDGLSATQLVELGGASGGDLPNPGAAVFETPLLQAGHSYFLRLTNTDDPAASIAYPYTYGVTLEMGDGDFESQQPGGNLPAEVESSANVVTIANTGAPVQVTDYVFHEADQDWFKVSTPAGATSLDISWDHAAIRATLGDYDALHKPLGGAFGVMAFDQAWFDTPGHSASPSETIGGTSFDFTPAVDSNTLTVNVSPNADYYILLDAVHGVDEDDPYTVTFTAN